MVLEIQRPFIGNPFEWNLAQADADTTHLQYIHGDQAKVPTPSHLALDGIILPKDDPFWKTHTGPWGHIGCVCYVRPMNEDLVNEARAKDQAQTNPEARNVLEGPVADELRNGTLMRDGRRHSVSPPEGDRAFQWHPDDLRLPLDQVMSRYDPPVRTAFESWARKTDTGDGTTVWNWLNGSELKAKPTPPPPPHPSDPSQTPGLASIPTPGVHAQIPPEIIGADEQLAGMNARAKAKVLAHEQEIMKLPHERCLVFDENGNVVMWADGDVSKIPLDHEQRRKLHGRVVTHNHPSGGTLSPVDVISACSYQVAELRVKTPLNTFSIRSGSRKLDARTLLNVTKAIHRLSPREPSQEQFHKVLKIVARENGLHYVVS